MIKLLMNRWFLGGITLVVLLGSLAWQEIRYKESLLIIQEKESALQKTSQELLQATFSLDQAKVEIQRQIELRVVSERINKDNVESLNKLRSENSLLKNSIEILKEDEDVEEYLGTVVPDSIINRLR